MISAWWLLIVVPASILSYFTGLLVHNMMLAIRAGCSFLRAFVYAVEEHERGEKEMRRLINDTIGVKK